MLWRELCNNRISGTSSTTQKIKYQGQCNKYLHFENIEVPHKAILAKTCAQMRRNIQGTYMDI